MTEKTLPPSKSGDGSRAARGLKDGPPIDQNSQTLINFPPVAPPGTAPSTVAHGPGETIQAPPPPAESPVPKGEINAGHSDPTIAQRPGIVDPKPAPPAAADPPPGPAGVATMEFVRPNPSDLTVSGAPDLTLGGNEAVKEASLHFDKAAEPGTNAGSSPGALPRVQDPGTREFRLADFIRDNPDATLAGHDTATRAFHLAAFTAPAHDATLGGHDAATQAFHQQALAAAPKAITTGASFGHYELIEPIAKGGMGIVYKARQRTLNRIVAIKMILAGQFADQSDIDRFYAEAEAAAALSHPNIVAIHEIGQVQGQHFFSMDYIEGKSLSALIQENPVPPRRAAEFVRTIAETMQFAHDSGVVHRDLKPANILLDKRQRPLITDFGLAKQVSNTSQLTMAGSVVGTPSYMPPEQAAGKIDEVGPWSDLYSLGAILYELLTGRPPFRAATPFETVRQVLEQEPPSPRLLNPALPRDLETIALKCLQKERARRYESAQELADELGRYLRGEPIHARPISQIHRFWRLCKRNPITSSAIASAVLALVAATVISFGFYLQATRSLAQEKIAKAKAVRKHSEAMQAINDLFTIVSENSLLNQPGTQSVRRELLEKARSYYERFSHEDPDDPEIAIELAGANFRMGRIAVMLGSLGDAIQPLNTARKMQERLLEEAPKDLTRTRALSDTLTQLGQVGVRLKDYDAASRDFAEALRHRDKLVGAFPNNTEYQRLLASARMNSGITASEVAEIDPDYQSQMAKFAEAREQFGKAQSIQESLLANGDLDPKIRGDITRDLAKCSFNLGNLPFNENDKNESAVAIGHFRSAVAGFEMLLQMDPKSIEHKSRLALCWRRGGDILTKSGESEEARKWYQQCLDRLDTLATENPDVPVYQYEKANLLLNWSLLEKKAGDLKAVRVALEKARDIYVPLADKFKADVTFQCDLAMTLRQLAKEENAAGNRQVAAAILQEATNRLQALVDEFPEEVEYGRQLAETKKIDLDKPPDQPTQPAPSAQP